MKMDETFTFEGMTLSDIQYVAFDDKFVEAVLDFDCGEYGTIKKMLKKKYGAATTTRKGSTTWSGKSHHRHPWPVRCGQSKNSFTHCGAAALHAHLLIDPLPQEKRSPPEGEIALRTIRAAEEPAARAVRGHGPPPPPHGSRNNSSIPGYHVSLPEGSPLFLSGYAIGMR